MKVMAVVETASPIGGELDEAFLDVAKSQMVQAESLHAGTIHQMAVGIQVVHLRAGGGVLAEVQTVEISRVVAAQRQRIDQGGLAHAGSTHEHAGVALQVRQ